MYVGKKVVCWLFYCYMGISCEPNHRYCHIYTSRDEKYILCCQGTNFMLCRKMLQSKLGLLSILLVKRRSDFFVLWRTRTRIICLQRVQLLLKPLLSYNHRQALILSWCYVDCTTLIDLFVSWLIRSHFQLVVVFFGSYCSDILRNVVSFAK